MCETIAIYNTKKKELIALFGNRKLARWYIFGRFNDTNNSHSRLNKAIEYKNILYKNKLGFNISIRIANKSQVELLAENDYLLLVDYIPKITFELLTYKL